MRGKAKKIGGRSVSQLRLAAKVDLEAGAYQPEDDIFDWLEYETTVEEVDRMEAWLLIRGIRETGQMRISEFARMS